jgi:hypothetical protein
MALDPIDPNTLYVPFGDDWVGLTLFKVTHGGANWTSLGCAPPFTCWGSIPGSEVNAFVIDPNAPATLYAATDIGVYRSTDGGVSFLPAGFANVTVTLLALDPRHSNVLYAAGSGPLGVYKSTDSGASWSSINQGLGEIIAADAAVNALLVDPDLPNILYLATSGYGVFKSSDSGATWAAFNDGLTSVNVTSLALVRPAREAPRGRGIGAFAPATLYAGTPVGVFAIRQETVWHLGKDDKAKLLIPCKTFSLTDSLGRDGSDRPITAAGHRR